MPFSASKEHPGITVFLGVGDIGLFKVTYDAHPDVVGVCFKQLNREFGPDEPWSADDDVVKECPPIILAIKGERGVVTMRKVVRMLEQQLGVDRSTLADKIIDGTLEE